MSNQSQEGSATNAGQAASASLGILRQMAIYQAGVQGQRPVYPLSVDELEQQAEAVLSPEAYAYVAGAAGAEDTMSANRDGFRRWRIVPRF